MPGTPYITPSMLTAAPAGISWKVVPNLTAPGPEQTAQLWAVCWRATSMVDTYCRQPLRATAFTQTETGPGQPRVFVHPRTGATKLITRRYPVTEITAVQVSPARAFPPQWTPVPADQVLIGRPMLKSAAPAPETGPGGGNVIEVAPRYVNWDRGRGGFRVMSSVVTGWPHTSLTADTGENASTLQVDDVTGWTGFTGFIYDAAATEIATVESVSAASPVQLEGAGGTVQAGPGTLTLSAPLANTHVKGTPFSALPADAIHSAILHAAVQALETIDAIATQSLSAQLAGGTGVLAEEAECLLDDYRNWG